MSSISDSKIEKNDEENEKKPSKKAKKKIELFPPLKTKPQAPKIEVLVENSCVFPKVGMVGKSEQITFVGHAKPVIKIILIKTIQYPNHLCSLSIDGKIKFWKINDNNIQKCLKNIDANFEAWDILMGNNNNIIVCGEEILMINLETDERIIIKEKRYYKYVDYNLLARINDDIGVSTSLNDYYLIFDLNQGNIIKQIEFDKTHFICQMEKNQKIKKEKSKKKKKENKEEDDDNEEEEENEDININNNSNKDNNNKKEEIKNEIQKMIRDLGSGKCKEYEGGHKGHVHAILGINNEKFKDSIISGGEDNLVKIININNPTEAITLSGHSNTIESLVLDNSKQYLYTPLAEEGGPGSLLKMHKEIALLRILLPDVQITAQQPGKDLKKGLADMDGNLQAIHCGANVLFYDLLPEAQAKAFRVIDERNLTTDGRWTALAEAIGGSVRL